jgi:DNA-binding transcriptional MocR family regulator
MRLNFSAMPPQLISEGIARLGAVVREMTEFYEGIAGS